MAIISIWPLQVGQVGVLPQTMKIATTDNLATVTAAGYLNGANLQGYTVSPNTVIEMLYSYNRATGSGTFGIFTVSITNGVITLSSWANPGDVLLPVVSGDFAVFNGTTGQIKDAGFLPSNAALTRVVMQSGASVIGNLPKYNDVTGTLVDSGVSISGSSGTIPIVVTPTIANHIATYTNTTGTLGEDAATAINGGNIQAGLSGTAGTLASFPGTASNGSLIVKAINNTGGFNSTLSNSNIGQATVYSLPDTASAAANVLATGAALVNGNINQSSGTDGAIVDSGIAALNVSIMKVFTLTFTQLAAAGKVNIQVHSSGTSQYFIQDIKVLTSTGLSGGGGNRLLAVTDGTLVWNNAGITAALLGTPIFTLWGGTGNPIAVSTSQVSTAGADIYFQYTGGTTDYTAGSVQIAVTYVKVTA